MATIGKYVFLFRMGMDVDEHFNSIIVLHYVLFNCVNFPNTIGPSCFPASVEIIARDVAS